MERVSSSSRYDSGNNGHSRFVVGRWLTFIALWLATIALPGIAQGAATESKKMPVVPKWERFERAFKSKVRYANPLQDASLTVRFTSPLGETFQVYGFWDGSKVWRVRFSPNQPGRWTFKTGCSDEANRGLHNQTGEFLCTAPIGPTRFDQHGLLRVASDHLHFEHADGTPFFWMSDTVWDGCRQSERKGWNYYAGLRASQGFSAAAWSVGPGRDSKGESAWTGYSDRISINPAFFKRLDTKVDTLSQAGILSVIAPIAELQSEGQEAPPLSDGQTTLFVRYVVARYGAAPVAWLLAFDGDVRTRKVAHWKHIGQSVFGTGPHAPVVLYAGDTGWLLDEFRDQSWVDAFAWKSVTDFSDDALKWTFAGPLTRAWSKEPSRPSVLFLPRENGLEPGGQKRFNADDVRRAAYWSLLLAPPAGLGYAAQGVVNWDTVIERQPGKITGGNFPIWQKSLFLPAAKQMSFLANFISPMEFWNLRPHPDLAATQPGDSGLHRYVAASSTDKKDLSLLYVPEDRTLEVALDGLPSSPAISWFKPRTGQANPAVAVVTSRSCQFPTPEPGDWLLVMKAGK